MEHKEDQLQSWAQVQKDCAIFHSGDNFLTEACNNLVFLCPAILTDYRAIEDHNHDVKN